MDTPVNTDVQTEPDLDQILEQIIEQLDRSGRELPVAAIRAAQQHREAITPRLIETIRKAISQARAGDPPEGNAHFFALFLLTEFQAKEAWPVILEAISLPDQSPYDLFGDATTETLARVLVVMVGDRLDVIDGLIRNREIDEFIRWESAQAYVHLMVAGRLTRDEAIRHVQGFLREAIENEEMEITAPLISVLADLGAREAREEIEKAFRLELVDESMIDLAGVESDLDTDDDTRRERISHYATGPILDTVAELETWAAFTEGESDDEDVDYEFPDDGPYDDEFADELDNDFLQPSSLIDLSHLSGQPFVDESIAGSGEVIDRDGTVRHTGRRVGRNDACPCGSGKKFKKCCGGRK
jgi:hypothetical protein